MQRTGISADVLLGIRRIVVRASVHLVVMGCVLFSGCGDRPDADLGFVNETQHSDAQLWALWKAAQTNLSRQIDLNPLQRQFSSVAPDILRGDSRVLEVSRSCLVGGSLQLARARSP